MIFLDHAATSYPKPPPVLDAMRNYLEQLGVNPGRGSYRTAAVAARVIFDAREALAQLLGIADSRHLSWVPNATTGINLVLRGYLRPGDHVVTTSMEHNAVLRPLNYLREKLELRVSTVRCDPQGLLAPETLAQFVNKGTRLVIINHASNVCGTIQPLGEIRKAIGNATLLVDAAQTAGIVPINVEREGIDILAVTGHKGLLGPQGTGALYIRPGLEADIEPLVFGGTGSNSESTEQPGFQPDRYEAGTQNGAGIAGLGAAVHLLAQQGIANVQQQEQAVTRQLLDGLGAIPGVALYGPAHVTQRTAVVSFNLAGWQPSDVGLALDRRYDIASRVGLHCAPAAHRTLGTFPTGSVRFSLGYFTTAADVQQAVKAVTDLAQERA